MFNQNARSHGLLFKERKLTLIFWILPNLIGTKWGILIYKTLLIFEWHRSGKIFYKMHLRVAIKWLFRRDNPGERCKNFPSFLIASKQKYVSRKSLVPQVYSLYWQRSSELTHKNLEFRVCEWKKIVASFQPNISQDQGRILLG